MAVSWRDVVGLSCLLVGCVMNLAVLVVPEWTVFEGLHYGLFKACENHVCNYYTNFLDSSSHYHITDKKPLQAVSALLTLSMLAGGAALILTAIFLYNKASRLSRFMSAAMGLSVLAGVLAIIGWAVWLGTWTRVGAAIHIFGAAFWITPFIAILTLIFSVLSIGIKKRVMIEYPDPYQSTRKDFVSAALQIQTYSKEPTDRGGQPTYSAGGATGYTPVPQDDDQYNYGYGGSPSHPPVFPKIYK